MKKTMKKIIATVLTAAMAMSVGMPAFASENTVNFTEEEKTIILEQAPDYFSQEYQNALREHNEEVSEYIEDKNVNARVSSSKVLAVPLYQQELTYYCGPASVQMVLSYINNRSYSQDYLAGQMNMNGSGAYVYQVANCLNNLMYSGTQYNYYEVYNTIFANNVVYSLDNDRPVVAHVKGSRLPAGGSNSGHYVVIKSYYHSGNPSNASIAYNDPHYNNTYYGSHTGTISQMENAVSAQAGFYISAQ